MKGIQLLLFLLISYESALIQLIKVCFFFSHDSIVCLTNTTGLAGNKAGVSKTQRVESYIVNNSSGSNILNNKNSHKEFNKDTSTFSPGLKHSPAVETAMGKIALLEKTTPNSDKQNHSSKTAVTNFVEESDTFCCDANSQLLGMFILGCCK